ncbi:MAG: RNHCP domain-containing protein [Alphaproteobacteria bacterium]|nr:RNHCP domain-containing protein [Alphaproteobacteria bacterium]MBQ4130535.1 RNHCP domain-containing protein [Alphaproteobacteria bacterium]MBQ8367770.1 RNHCP domain-containing protein [Alphaproteobacteria bacterium]
MKNFTKTVEDFNCAHCGAVVHGNGYTNHCPQCLWSRHVDNAPGDRAATCGGMMKPVMVESDGDKFIITHRCEICGKEKRQRTSDADDVDAIIELSRNLSFIYGH